jgi:hypothetical protein
LSKIGIFPEKTAGQAFSTHLLKNENCNNVKKRYRRPDGIKKRHTRGDVGDLSVALLLRDDIVVLKRGRRKYQFCTSIIRISYITKRLFIKIIKHYKVKIIKFAV